jgi:hypothetical protein
MSENSEFLKYKIISTKSDVLTRNNVKMEVFWNAAPCSVVDGYERFEGTVVAIYSRWHGMSTYS